MWFLHLCAVLVSRSCPFGEHVFLLAILEYMPLLSRPHTMLEILTRIEIAQHRAARFVMLAKTSSEKLVSQPHLSYLHLLQII